MKNVIFLTVLLATATFSQSLIAAESAEEPITKTLVWPDGTRYVGGVVDGKRAGKGTIFWQDGTRCVGQFENDMRNGPGTMILPDGTVYTGFFKNDELVDTEATIAASNAQQSLELGEEESALALDDTDLPMEADSVSQEQMVAAMDNTPLPQVDENDPVESSTAEKEADIQDSILQEKIVEEQIAQEQIAQEQIAQERAVREQAAQEPIVEGRSQASANETFARVEEEISDPFTAEVTEVTEAVKDELTETIDLWGAAWSEQNVPQYLANYSEDFRVPNRQSRRNWEATRKSRLTRPQYIKIDITNQRFEFVKTNVIDVFFRQAYRSNTYSDLTDKVLRMRKEGSDWKILIERSR